MNQHSLYQEAGPSFSSFYDTQYMYQQHPTLPSPPSSPQFSWQVTTIDQDAHTHTYHDHDRVRPSSKARRTQVPAETMSSLMSGPDPADGKYICLYGGCMRRFGRKYNIQSHIQTHLSDRPFRCTVCAAGFVRRHDLVRHARIHGSGKDFTCGCGKGFSRMDALNRHRHRQICVGGIKSRDDTRSMVPKKSSTAQRSTHKTSTRASASVSASEEETEESESYRGGSFSVSESPEPELGNLLTQPPQAPLGMQLQQPLGLHAAARRSTLQQPYAFDAFREYEEPSMATYEVKQSLACSRDPHDVYRQSMTRTPVPIAPVARYPDGSDMSPNRVLSHQDMWVNPTLISPAMTNSSQFYSENEDAPYYY